MVIGPHIDNLTTELAAMIAEHPLWGTALRRQPSERLHDVLAAETLAHLNRQAFSRTDIHDRQGPNPLPVRQLIGDNIQGPGVLRSRHRGPMPPHGGCFAPPRRPMTQGQAFLPVQAIHEVLAHGPAFASEQHPNLAIAIAHAGLSELIDPLPERGAGIPMMAIPIGGPRTAGRSAGAAFADRIRRAQILHHHPPLRGPYHCFVSTSWSMTLSTDKSATNRFNLAFSSWSCLNWRTCSDSSPAYRRFHREKVCSAIPRWRISSATGAPTSACLRTATICSTLKRLRFTASSFPLQGLIMPDTLLPRGPKKAGPTSRHTRPSRVPSSPLCVAVRSRAAREDNQQADSWTRESGAGDASAAS